jgi:hypothetical protein
MGVFHLGSSWLQMSSDWVWGAAGHVDYGRAVLCSERWAESANDARTPLISGAQTNT